MPDGGVHIDGGAARRPSTSCRRSRSARACSASSRQHGPSRRAARADSRQRLLQQCARVVRRARSSTPAASSPSTPSRLAGDGAARRRRVREVAVQNGDDESTRRTLDGGYTFDAFYVEPVERTHLGGHGRDASRAGHRLETKRRRFRSILRRAKSWRSEAEGARQELDCRTPDGTPGAQAVRVTTGEDVVTVLDALHLRQQRQRVPRRARGQPLADELRWWCSRTTHGRAIAGATVDPRQREQSASALSRRGTTAWRRQRRRPRARLQTVTVARPLLHAGDVRRRPGGPRHRVPRSRCCPPACGPATASCRSSEGPRARRR